jgi:hypothetical protein
MTQNPVDPELDSELIRLIARYGTPSVMTALKRLTQSKRGRKTIQDWPLLIPDIDQEARAWLSSEESVLEISNYAIAKEFAKQRPGQSELSTHKRIEKKLVESRELIKLIRAMEIGSSEYPYAAYIRTLRALCEKYNHRSCRMALDSAEASISKYEARWGERPSDQLSMDQIEAETPPSGLSDETKGLIGSLSRFRSFKDTQR